MSKAYRIQSNTQFLIFNEMNISAFNVAKDIVME